MDAPGKSDFLFGFERQAPLPFFSSAARLTVTIFASFFQKRSSS
jgi:hypothetical protein